ncbi:Transcriptional regulatory protein LiaR [compost metagenome]
MGLLRAGEDARPQALRLARIAALEAGQGADALEHHRHVVVTILAMDRLPLVELARILQAPHGEVGGGQGGEADVAQRAVLQGRLVRRLQQPDDPPWLVQLQGYRGILRSSMPDVMARASLCRARITAQGDSPQAALDFLEAQAAHFHVQGLDRLLALMLAEQVRLLLEQGELRRATERVAQLAALETAQRTTAEARGEIAAIATFARARLALAGSDPAWALEGLATIRVAAEKSGRMRTLVRARLLSALAHDELGERDAALEHFQAAVESAARLGLVRTVLDEGRAVLARLAAWRNEAELGPQVGAYLDGLLADEEPDDEAPAAAPASMALAGGPRASLTPREVEILGLVAQAMSNKRIALTLNITFGTVKWNVKNILAKLGVSSRYAAISLARQQGLLK